MMVKTFSHEAVEHAMGLWRDGRKQATRFNLPEDWRAEYWGAVSCITPLLRRFQSMQELVAAYYDTPADIDAALDRVCYPASGHILNSGIVEDAAFCEWARFLLLTAGNGGPA